MLHFEKVLNINKLCQVVIGECMKRYKIKIYKDSMGEWRFSIVASNGRIVADSGEGYRTKYFCRKNVNRIIEQIRREAFTIEE